MPKCYLCDTEFTNNHNQIGMIYATKNYKKVFFLKFIVNADMKDGEGMKPARLCNDCRQKLFDELVRSNERDNGTTK